MAKLNPNVSIVFKAGIDINFYYKIVILHEKNPLEIMLTSMFFQISNNPRKLVKQTDYKLQ